MGHFRLLVFCNGFDSTVKVKAALDIAILMFSRTNTALYVSFNLPFAQDVVDCQCSSQ
jgi:hypothetical protein